MRRGGQKETYTHSGRKNKGGTTLSQAKMRCGRSGLRTQDSGLGALLLFLIFVLLLYLISHFLFATIFMYVSFWVLGCFFVFFFLGRSRGGRVAIASRP